MQKENIIKNYQQLWQKQNLTNGSEKKNYNQSLNSRAERSCKR